MTKRKLTKDQAVEFSKLITVIEKFIRDSPDQNEDVCDAMRAVDEAEEFLSSNGWTRK